VEIAAAGVETACSLKPAAGVDLDCGAGGGASLGGIGLVGWVVCSQGSISREKEMNTILGARRCFSQWFAC
jgi:hypothetical protein